MKIEAVEKHGNATSGPIFQSVYPYNKPILTIDSANLVSNNKSIPKKSS